MHERLLYQKLSLCSEIHKNNFDPWHPRQTQLEKYRPLCSSIIEKIYSAIEHRQDLSRSVFGFKFQDVAYSFSSDPLSLHHRTKSNNINQLLNAPASHSFHTKWKPIIILEMCSITGANGFSLLDNISCFNDFPAVLYYNVLRIDLIYDRIDAIFDHYLDWSFKEATRITVGAGKRFRFTDLSKILKSFERFLYISQNKKISKWICCRKIYYDAWKPGYTIPIQRRGSMINSLHIALFIFMFFIWKNCHRYHWRWRDDIVK